MKKLQGDLLEMFDQGVFNIILHGANCRSTMNSGIAKQIKEKYPGAYKADCEDKRSPEEKLGGFSYYFNNSEIIINAYTQLNYGVGLQVSYPHMKRAFNSIADYVVTVYSFSAIPCIKIGYPLIGCGLGGGDWKIVSSIIDEAFKNFDHTLVQLS